MDESASFSGENHNWKHEVGRKEALDSEMLKTYSTGLLAVCLTGYGLFLDFMDSLSLFSFVIIFLC